MRTTKMIEKAVLKAIAVLMLLFVLPVKGGQNVVGSIEKNVTNFGATKLYEILCLQELGLSKVAFDIALKGKDELEAKGVVNNHEIITIIDFSLPSYAKRLFVIDLKNNRLLLNTYVAHGRNSGEEYAKNFSNRANSFQSSLGFYVTGSTYQGKHGYSMRLNGVEKGINDEAEARGIVIHAADYVSEQFIHQVGRLGRSQGCPAVSSQVINLLIETIKDGSCLFIYSPSSVYLSKSNLI